MRTAPVFSPSDPIQGEDFNVVFDFGNIDLSSTFTFSINVREAEGGSTLYDEVLAYSVNAADVALLSQGKLRVRYVGTITCKWGDGTRFIEAKVTNGTNVYRSSSVFTLRPMTVDAPKKAVLEGYVPPTSIGDADTLEGSNKAYYRDRANHTGSQAISTVAGLQTTLDGKAGSGHTHTKASIGLGSVDNTSDADKPPSDATVAALNTKITKKTDIKVVASSNYTIKTEDSSFSAIEFTNTIDSAATINVFIDDQSARPTDLGDPVVLFTSNVGQIHVQPAVSSSVTIDGTKHRSPGNFIRFSLSRLTGERHIVDGGVD